MITIRRISTLLAFLVLVSLASGMAAAAPSRATVREYRRSIRTYPFSDPNPIAAPGRIYPYFRFDGYTNVPVDREWTVVELENDFLKVTVLPEIGGKIWSAVEKSTGRSFIYDNHVVKFRDIAMRGPWTSGGIEPNYGIIGHTPNCATAVDYQARTNPDGSATVVIGVLDLLTRTPWRLAITLPADAAYFTTTSFWHNATPLEQAYYTWMNAGIKAAGHLELVYPGTHHIGHAGELGSWPVDSTSGRNLAFYEQNDFGPAKSYHVLGRASDFFGAYWHDEDFGMGHYATRDDKLGKKAWIWGLSRQGMIWERLLTDTDGQYVEVQSGRLFNQAAEGSTLTPFKHRGFEPYSSDSWTEYWFPVKGTDGFVMANEYGALNVIPPGGRVLPLNAPPSGAAGGTGKAAPSAAAPAAQAKAGLELRFSALQAMDEPLEVFDGDRVVFSTRLVLAPMQVWTQTIDATVPGARLRVRIGDRMDYRGGDEDALSRPLESPRGFDWESVQGLHLQGKEWLRQREYLKARASLEACLQKDPNYLPALADLALLRYRALDDKGARELASRGLAIDAYDPASNYYYGLASARLGRVADALDGFQVAASAPGFRAAAWTELARLHEVLGHHSAAVSYAGRAIETNPQDVNAWQILATAERARGRREAAGKALETLAALDPLSPFVAFERHLASGDEASRQALLSGVRNEMPHETFLELAAWYLRAGRRADAARLLALAPPQAEVLYWQAWLLHFNDEAAARSMLAKAEAASPRFVFPFRDESAAVFEWAVGQSATWRGRYYLALVAWSHDDVARARQLLDECGASPDFAPFYATRAKAFEGVAGDRALSDLRRAAELDPAEWRFGKLLAERYLEDAAFDKAVEVAGRYRQQVPGNYIIGMLYAKSLLRAGRAGDAAAVLARLEILPYEGSTEGRALYREAQLLVGAAAFKAGRVAEARRCIAAAREWPERLGAGRPYPEDTDERLEDWLEARCLEATGHAADAARLREKVAAWSRPGRPATPWPQAATADEARILNAWERQPR